MDLALLPAFETRPALGGEARGDAAMEVQLLSVLIVGYRPGGNPQSRRRSWTGLVEAGRAGSIAEH